MAGFLVSHPHKSNLFCFASLESWKKLCEPDAEPVHGLFKGTIVASYSSFGEAWDMISSSSSPLTLLALDGLFMKKTPGGNNWVPVIIGYSTTIPYFVPYEIEDKPCSIESEISIWHILDLHRLLSYEMDSSVAHLLQFLCGCIWDEYTGTHDGKEWRLERLLKNFRDLDEPEIRTEENDQKEAKRHKVKQIANKLKDIVLEILQHVSPDKVSPSAAIIKNAFGNKFKNINQAELEKFLLKSMAHANQIRDILLGTYGLDTFFGATAVAENNELVRRVVPSKSKQARDEYYEWSDKIFEDESDTIAPTASKRESSSKGAKVAFGKAGFGNPCSSVNQVLSLVGPHPPLYYYFLDKIVHKHKYTPESGCVLAYLLNDSLFKFAADIKEKMAEWYLNVLRSPLSDRFKGWLLRMSCQRLGEPPPTFDLAQRVEVSTAKHRANISPSVVISSCLSRACPHPVIRYSLKNVCRLPRAIEAFCQRRDDKYGVFFCGTSTLRAMREAGLWVEVVDLGAARATGIATIDEFYLQIIGAFNAFTYFVYVQGLPSIEDLFLKWCCEYTQRCPWRFIFFENTDSSHNFSENRDRCNDNFYLHPSLEEWLLNQYGTNTEICSVTYRHHRGGNCETMLKEHFDDIKKSSIKSRFISDWETQIGDIRSRFKQYIVFVESPPGAGKTHLMEQIIEEESKLIRCVRVDCSNDELVERAMESVLSSHFSEETQSILIADEFHMLSEEHKTQLVHWVSTRLNWLRIFIIANRSSDFDDMLLEKLKGSQVLVRKMVCRLEVSKILRLHLHTNENVNTFMDMWHTATRGLFGDESISLRHASKLKEIIQNQSTLPNIALAAFFRSKMPAVGSYMCEHFTNCVLHFYNLRCKRLLKLPPDTPFSSPVHLLVETALITATSDGSNISSYPEFIRSLKGSMKVHPILRLAAWVKRVHIERKFEEPPLDCLLQLKLIDQIGFPLVVDLASNSTLHSCDTFAQRGNYNNLKWMHDTLTHGYAINWNEVSGFWKSHFITNSSQFEDLLSVCPNPGSCIQAVDPKNLSVLIESGSHRLATWVIEFYETGTHQFHRELTQADSPYYAAAWFLLRQQAFPFSLQPLWELNIDVLNVLIWASRFGFHALYVKDRYQERTEFLQQTLIQTTIDLVNKIDKLKANSNPAKQVSDLENQIITLWSHVFSPLLRVGTQHNGVPHSVTLLLAAHQFPPKSDWPVIVKYLSAILHNKAEKHQVEHLLESDLFYRLHERHEYDPDHNFALPLGQLGIRFVTGLMMVGPPGSVLSKKWQVHLLTTEKVVIPDHFCNPKGLLQLEQGLATLQDPSHIMIMPGKVRSSLECNRVFSKNTNVFVTDRHKQVSMAERKQQKYNMRFVKNITSKYEILKYYNVYVGVDWTTIEVTETEKFKLDEHNNPKGDKFDLGKTGAFGGFRVLIGNFFQRGEFSTTLFKKYVQAALERKGFNVTMVNEEEEFIRILPHYDLAWLISSDALDWNVRRNTTDVHKWRLLAEACQRFYLSGRGLFIFADNEPYLDHASVVLERLFNVTLTGNTPAKKTLQISRTSFPTKGTFCSSHLIGSGLRTLFEGDTVSYPKGDISTKGLHVFARSTDDHPVIFYGENNAGGRVVVDTGFTKLWVEWNSAGTERYVCNATVWLLALEHRLNKGYPLRGPTTVVPNVQLGTTPQHAPKEVKSGKADIVLVVDGSSSVSKRDFARMKDFSLKLATQLVKPNIVRFGVVQFASIARIECGMTYQTNEITHRITGMYQMRQGTEFDTGLLAARSLFQSNDKRASKIIIFQTDGEGQTSVAKALRDEKIAIFAIGVGQGVVTQNLVDLAGHVNSILSTM